MSAPRVNLFEHKPFVSAAVAITAITIVAVIVGITFPSLTQRLLAWSLGEEVQNSYRWYQNADSLTPGAPLAAQDTPASLASTGDQFRLRLTVRASGGTLGINDEDMKLQFAERGADAVCDDSFTNETYADVTAGTEIAFFNNPGVADEANISAEANDPNPSGTEIPQSYQEANPFTNSQAGLISGQNGLWDFSLVDNGATGGATYCLRAINDSGSLFASNTPYLVLPEITMAAGGGGGGGGGGSSCPFASGSFSLNDGALTTTSRQITITTETTNVAEYVVSEHLSFVGATFQPLPEDGIIPFELSAGNGPKTVFMLFRNNCSTTPTFSSTIELGEAAPVQPPQEPACNPEAQDRTPNDGDPAAACIREGEPGSRTNPNTAVPLGRYVRTVNDTTVYYITPDGRRKPVLDSRTFFTHEDTFGVVEYVTSDVIERVPQAHPVLPLPDSILVTFWDSPSVYVVLPNSQDTERPMLRRIDSELLAERLFGPGWRSHVVDFNTAFHMLFADGLPIFSTQDLPQRAHELRLRDDLSTRAGMIKIESKKRSR